MYKSRFGCASGAYGGMHASRLPARLWSCQPSSRPQTRPWGRETGPAPSLSVWAASEAERRSRSVRLRLRPTHMATLMKATVLRSAMAFTCRVFDCSLGAGDHWKGLRHLGPSAAAVGRCGGSVEGAVDRAVRRVRERVRRFEASGQGAAGRRAQGCGALKWAGGGKGRPLTLGR